MQYAKKIISSHNSQGLLYVTPPYMFRKRVMHDCPSILDSNAKGTSSNDFLHTAPLATSPFINFCTCDTQCW